MVTLHHLRDQLSFSSSFKWGCDPSTLKRDSTVLSGGFRVLSASALMIQIIHILDLVENIGYVKIVLVRYCFINFQNTFISRKMGLIILQHWIKSIFLEINIFREYVKRYLISMIVCVPMFSMRSKILTVSIIKMDLWMAQKLPREDHPGLERIPFLF